MSNLNNSLELELRVIALEAQFKEMCQKYKELVAKIDQLSTLPKDNEWLKPVPYIPPYIPNQPLQPLVLPWLGGTTIMSTDGAPGPLPRHTVTAPHVLGQHKPLQLTYTAPSKES